MGENSYGFEKRVQFIQRALTPGMRSVLDIGCGTGADVTLPLAEAHPAVDFLGVDADEASVEYAQQHNARPNLRFSTSPPQPGDGPYDLIIASEVLEHVEQPDEFLVQLRDLLSDGGRLILTVPNGYGLFEAATLAEVLIFRKGWDRHLRRVKRRLLGRPQPTAQLPSAAPPAGAAHGSRNTLAFSPHINFFSARQLLQVVRDAGYSPVRIQPRTVACGLGFDSLIRPGSRLATWNATVADRLPLAASSGWMLELLPTAEPSPSRYRRGRVSSWRRRFNESRPH